MSDTSNLDIPTPKNVKPGDDFYQNIKPSNNSSGQTMMFEPPAELVEIPTHGVHYKDITDDPDILERGSIRIRPMTVHEERILTTNRIVKSGQAIDMVFRNVIKSKGKNGEPLDPSLLLSSDRIFLMLWLRSISYDNIYKFNLQCPNCEKRFEYEVDLAQHDIKELDPENTDPEPYEFVLPKWQYKVYYRLPRGVDELALAQSSKGVKKIDETDDTVVKRLASIVLRVEDPQGNELPKQQIPSFIESMITGDASAFRKELENRDAGIEDIKDIECPHCSYEYDTAIPITESFFRTN